MLRPFHKEPFGGLRPVPFAKALVLCIEDDAISLHLRRAVLEEEGYNVIGVTNSKDALQTLREAPVCCTITDHILHGWTGIELAKEMKNIKPDVPIILHSGTPPQKLENIDVYVSKSEAPATFLKIVREVVQRYYS